MAKKHLIIPIFVPHAGCPHRCVFCDQRQISGRRAIPTPDDVRRQIEDGLSTIGDPAGRTVEVAFFGGSFTALPQQLQRELLEPARYFWKKGRLDYLRLSTRPDCLEPSNLEWLYDWGVRVVELGVQSLEPEVLSRAKRGHTAADARAGAGLVSQLGFQLGLQMMVGLPGDSPEAALRTGHGLAALRPDFVRIYPVLVLKGTELAGMWSAGSYRPWDLLTTIEVCGELLQIFETAGIPVIRLGLQASEQVNLFGDVLAGPFHPALRELVESSLARERVETALRTAGLAKEPDRKNPTPVEITVSPQDISIVRGHYNSNLCYFRRIWGVDLKVTPCPGVSRRTFNMLKLM